MQPQEQIISAPTALSWIGAEFTSILQLLFFLILGYSLTRSWMWSKKRSHQAPAKKIDDIDEVPAEIQGTSCSESDATPAVKSKANARNSNAIERRNKKMKEVAPKKDELSKESVPATPEPAPVLLENKPQELPEQHIEQCQPEHEVDSPQTLTDSAEDATTQVSELRKSAKSEEQVAKLMAKKAQRKAKKAQEQTVAEETPATAPPVESVRVEAPVAEVPVAEAPAAEAPVAEAPVAEAPVAQAPAVQVGFEKAASSKAAKKALRAQQRAEVTPSIIQADETPVESIAVVPEKVEDDMKENMQDNTETDVHSDSEEVHSSLPDGIATPERCLTPADPMMWCGAGVPQIEGWTAIMVPAEYAPPGAPGPFDGLWKNQADERIVVDHEEILFESGMKWVMEMLSLGSFSVTVGDEVFTAEMDAPNQRLLWSDGDIWICVGQTDGQQRWAAEREAMGMPGVLLDGEQMFPMMDDTEQMVAQEQMMMMMPVPQNQLVPEDAETWEVCWDWSKKGWCSRGVNCDWYHPMEPGQQFETCAPCGYGGGKGDCKFGAQCTRQDCHFNHPNREGGGAAPFADFDGPAGPDF